MADPGFQIGPTFYPVPDHFTLGDAVLVEEAAGLTFEDFAAQLDGEDMTAKALIGLVAVAVQHAHPRWTPDRVAQFVRSVDWEQFQNIEGDELPLAAAPEAESPSAEPSDESIPSPEPTPEDPV